MQVELIRTIEIKDASGRVIGSKDVVTYAGLLSKAHEEGLSRVATKLVQVPSESNGRVAVAHAMVQTTKGRFDGIGDACPDNVNAVIIPHLIRMAETRAKARALRDAVNVGIVSFEELDSDEIVAGSSDLGSGAPKTPSVPVGNGQSRAGNGAATHPNGNSTTPMTEAQRRYLFRLLAADGITGDGAHGQLLDLFGVKDLSQVGKGHAAQIIDRLLKRQPAEASNAVHQR